MDHVPACVLNQSPFSNNLGFPVFSNRLLPTVRPMPPPHDYRLPRLLPMVSSFNTSMASCETQTMTNASEMAATVFNEVDQEKVRLAFQPTFDLNTSKSYNDKHFRDCPTLSRTQLDVLIGRRSSVTPPVGTLSTVPQTSKRAPLDFDSFVPLSKRICSNSLSYHNTDHLTNK